MSKRLGECLVNAGLITETQLVEALQLQRSQSGFLGEILLEQGWITDAQLCQAISEALHINCVSIDNILIDEAVLRLVSGSLAISSVILPIFIHHDMLYLAMEKPRDIGVIQLVEYQTGLRVRPLLTPSWQLREKIQQYYGESVPEDSEASFAPPVPTSAALAAKFAMNETPTDSERNRLGDWLVAAGLLTSRQIDTAVELQKGSPGFLGHLLVELGWITEEQICQALSAMLNVEHVNLEEVRVDPKVVRLLSDSLVASCNIFPLFIEQHTLYLAMENPLDTGVIQLIQYHLGMKVKPLVAPPTQIRKVIRLYYPSRFRVGANELRADEEAAAAA